MADNVLIPVAVGDMPMARLNITYNGQNGDLLNLVPYDSSDETIKQMAAEAMVQQGQVPGIDAVANADFANFVVDRFPATEGVAFNRLSLRPKTPFGDEGFRPLDDDYGI